MISFGSVPTNYGSRGQLALRPANAADIRYIALAGGAPQTIVPPPDARVVVFSVSKAVDFFAAYGDVGVVAGAADGSEQNPGARYIGERLPIGPDDSGGIEEISLFAASACSVTCAFYA